MITLNEAATTAIIKSYVTNNLIEISDKIMADKNTVLHKVASGFIKVSNMNDLNQLKKLHKEIESSYDFILECLRNIAGGHTYNKYAGLSTLEKSQEELSRSLNQFEEITGYDSSGITLRLRDRYNVLRLISEGLYKKLVIQ
ncbi:hypothetical protein [Shouchella clausii]|uniref:hypothetical protein n=1 Tax=Shouchella clausii TaxID=79880 RepID=UPI001C729E20|nr:hypothetical protein [Shouchella clausii]MBX0320228.1 hypothetical protein [Shouchella clausii]